MANWENRSLESKILLNPAFTGLILSCFVNEYKNVCATKPSFLELYLILPIVLHNETRVMIPPRIRKKMRVWLSENEHIKLTFPKRAKGLKVITDEAIIFLSAHGNLSIDNEGRVELFPVRGMTKVVEGEISDIIRVTKIVAKWFAEIKDATQLFRLWGVKP